MLAEAARQLANKQCRNLGRFRGIATKKQRVCSAYCACFAVNGPLRSGVPHRVLPTRLHNTMETTLNLCADLQGIPAGDGSKTQLKTVNDSLTKQVRWYATNGVGEFRNCSCCNLFPPQTASTCTRKTQTKKYPDKCVSPVVCRVKLFRRWHARFLKQPVETAMELQQQTAL